MIEHILMPWPWYISGPLIGLMVPFLFLIGNKAFGVSSNLKHLCSMIAPKSIVYFNYDWKKERWNLIFILGVVLGGFLATKFFSGSTSVAISNDTVQALAALGIRDIAGLMPESIFSFHSLFTFNGSLHVILGGFLVGFGTRYAEGCTSGHAITGLSLLRFSSLIAVIGFFIGGMITVYLIYPVLF